MSERNYVFALIINIEAPLHFLEHHHRSIFSFVIAIIDSVNESYIVSLININVILGININTGFAHNDT